MSERKVEMMNLEMADEISDFIELRQGKFDEPLDVSIKVVLFNYGDHRRIAHCLNGEWSGPKSELVSVDGGVPHCPNGHACTEEAIGWGLALVDGHDPWGIGEEQNQ